MWVEVMEVAADPVNRSRHRVVLRTGEWRFPALWPGPAPHVGAVRVVSLACDTVAELGVTAFTDAPADRPVPAGLIAVEAVLRSVPDDGVGQFVLGAGGAIALKVAGAGWQAGQTVRLELGTISAFDTRIN